MKPWEEIFFPFKTTAIKTLNANQQPYLDTKTIFNMLESGYLSWIYELFFDFISLLSSNQKVLTSTKAHCFFSPKQQESEVLLPCEAITLLTQWHT